MCGLAGKMCFYNKPINNLADVDSMLQISKHRGPDDSGVCGISLDLDGISLQAEMCTENLNGNIIGVLGFNRLSIQDLSAKGHQPMYSEDKNVVITFNGEIYNANKYRNMLISKGYCFSSRTDTEVILKMYLEYGFEQTVRMLNGMFSIVLYDCRSNILYITRDRMGIIPLYVYQDKDIIAWGSEIKCFRNVSFYDPKENYTDITTEFLYCFPSVSMYDQITVFEPGTIMKITVSSGLIEQKQYFDINTYTKWDMTFDEAYEVVCEGLRNSVRRQLIADCPLGVQFSGGVDSTLIAALASEEYARKNVKLHGFSLINTASQLHDESKYINYAASRIPIELHTVDMNVNRFINDLEICTYALERPLNDPSPLGIYEFSKIASAQVKVLLSGEGADELCGGYSDFGKLLNNKIPLGSDDFVMAFNRQIEEKKCERLLIHADLEGVLHNRKVKWNACLGSDFDKIRKFYFYSLLQGMLERQNKMCMINSVENRVPILDNEMIEIMMSIPETYLSGYAEKEYEGKYILKKYSEQVYGSNFAFRKKQFIRVPIIEYITSDRFKKYVKCVIIPQMRDRGIVNFKEFINLYENMNMSNVMAVWKAINIELWCELFIDKREPQIIALDM